MHLDDFTATSPGHLVATVDGRIAFVPNPLPPQFDMALVALPLAEARQAVGELRGASRHLANPYLLIAPLQRREALTSSAMEGTFTTISELVMAEAGIERSDPDTVEVSNYIRAMRQAVTALTELPISHRLIRDAHRTLLTDTIHGRGASKRPGEYKERQNWIGSPTLASARFVPPPPAEAAAAMNDLESWINRSDHRESDPLIDMALAHYQFETIHPFDDGNGRIGRLVVSLMALTTGLLREPVLYISPVIEQRKDAYIDLMYAVSTKGAWEDWIVFFCKAVADSCRHTIAIIDRLTDLRRDFTERIHNATNSANDLKVLDLLFNQPVLRIADIRSAVGVTPQGARNVVDRLISIGILQELSGWYPKVFYAPQILTISDR